MNVAQDLVSRSLSSCVCVYRNGFIIDCYHYLS